MIGVARALVAQAWEWAAPEVAHRLRMAAQYIDPQPVMVYHPSTGTHRIYLRRGDEAVPLADLTFTSGGVGGRSLDMT